MGNSSNKEAGSQQFSSRSTAEEVAHVYGQHGKDKFIVITGSNCGLGLETARVLAKHGSHITIACRNLAAGEDALSAIKKESPDADVEVRLLDLANLQSIRNFAKGYRDSGRPLHILINNAGVMACPKSATSDGLETQIGVNHMGHFLLTNELLSVLKRSGTTKEPARVVNLSSIANFIFSPPQGIRIDDLSGDKHYSVWERYGSSKLANILFSNELNRRMQAENAPVISIALHPGVIMDTNLMRHSNNVGHMASLLGSLNGFPAMSAMMQDGGKTIPQGAATTVLCALSPEIQPGGYYMDCAPSTLLHAKATDLKLAQDLWDISEKLTSLPPSQK